MKRRCRCAQGYCCDACWRREAKNDPCSTDGCQNPARHTGPHGRFNNTGVVVITEADILAAMAERT